MPTKLTSLSLGDVVTNGLVAAAVAGSVMFASGGGTYTERGTTNVVNNYLGTGAYMNYQDAVCTNTGGLFKYTACSLQLPTTGTSALMRVQLDSNKAPSASSVTCVTSSDNTATGAALFKYQATASGRSIANGAPRAVTPGSGALLAPPGTYVRCWHSTTPGVGLKQQLRVWYNTQYIP